MALETSTYINGLVASNPTSTDPKSQGDDHLRLIKAAILATWPNHTGAVTATHTELNYVVGVTSAIQTQINTKYTAGSTTQALGTPISGNLVNCTGVTVPVSSLTNATGSATLAIANNSLAWNWTLTGASTVGRTIGETSASTGGAGLQVLCKIGTLAASTADPLQVQTRGVDTIRVSRTGGITLTAGSVAATAAPIITITGGISNAAQSGNSGSVVIDGGAAGAVASVAGGKVLITGGAGSVTTTGGVGGAVTVAAGAGGLSAAGGLLTLSGGAAGSSNSYGGAVTLTAADAAGSGTGGAVTITSGNSGTTAKGGALTITAGQNNTNLQGSDLNITGGANISTGRGGFVNISGGASTSGSGGDVVITPGAGLGSRLNLVNCNVANAAVGCVFTASVGPTGAGTAIAGWLAIKVSGTNRFIPFW